MSTIIEQRISEAEEALHQLNIGKRVVSISRNGKAVTYSSANRADLELYIANLKASKSAVRRRPMRVYV